MDTKYIPFRASKIKIIHVSYFDVIVLNISTRPYNKKEDGDCPVVWVKVQASYKIKAVPSSSILSIVEINSRRNLNLQGDNNLVQVNDLGSVNISGNNNSVQAGLGNRNDSQSHSKAKKPKPVETKPVEIEIIVPEGQVFQKLEGFVKGKTQISEGIFLQNNLQIISAE